MLRLGVRMRVSAASTASRTTVETRVKEPRRRPSSPAATDSHTFSAISSATLRSMSLVFSAVRAEAMSSRVRLDVPATDTPMLRTREERKPVAAGFLAAPEAPVAWRWRGGDGNRRRPDPQQLPCWTGPLLMRSVAKTSQRHAGVGTLDGHGGRSGHPASHTADNDPSQ